MLKMKKIWIWCCRRQRNPRQDRERLLQDRNNNARNGYGAQEQVELQAMASQDGSGFLLPNDSRTRRHRPSNIHRSVAEHFPELLENADRDLQQELLNLKETLRKELLGQRSLQQQRRPMGDWIYDSHCQTFARLSLLLQRSCSFCSCFLLLQWVLRIYLSQELLGHPDLQDMDPMHQVDWLLVTELVEEVVEKLLKHMQMTVGQDLEKILQFDRKPRDSDDKEAFVGLYVDIIQYIEARNKEAQEVSRTLSVKVRNVCFQELLNLLDRFNTKQVKLLKEEATIDKPQILQIFMTLKTCSELQQYVRNTSEGISSFFQEIIATLEKMEGFFLTYLKKLVSDFTKKHLKFYFTKPDRQFLNLMSIVEETFSGMDWCQDIHKRAMDEVYEGIARTYLQCLVQVSRRKLVKRWSSNVGQSIAEDAKDLHETMLSLAPGVHQWNLMLLKIKELLECDRKIRVTLLHAKSMQDECPRWREDMDLLPDLLRWKGLNKCEVRRVLNALSE